MNGYISDVLTFMIGDIFYYADSFTYDQISEFYFALNYIDTHDVVPSGIDCPPPEAAFFPFIKSRGIRNVTAKWGQVDFKIMRSQEYIDLKKSLLDYEII